MMGLSGIVVLDAGIGVPEVSTACGGSNPFVSCAAAFEMFEAEVFELDAVFELAAVFWLLAAAVFETALVFEPALAFELAWVFVSWMNEEVAPPQASIHARQPGATSRMTSDFSFIFTALEIGRSG
jgi:hypothetical protein